MFFGHINTVNFKQYPQAIQIALRYLKNTDFDVIAAGRYEIKGDLIYAQVLDLDTQDKSLLLPEVHRHYLDVQYLHSGTEKIGVAIDLGNNIIAENYDSARDIQFYSGVQNESELVMQVGNFAVFFPEDIHRPGCINIQTNKIRKVVVKVAMSELG